MELVSSLVEVLVAPFEYAFMQRALVAALLVGSLCALIGSYVVLRGLAFLGDALAHAVFPGVVIAFLLGANFFLGAIVAGLLTALGIGYVSRRTGVREDTSIGILFAGAFALGVVLLSGARTYRGNLTDFLLGNVLGVSALDLGLTIAIALGVLAVLLLLHKELLLTSFDPQVAAAMGLPTAALTYMLLVLVALVVVVSLQTVGNILVVAMLLTPSATAYLLVDRFPRMMGLGALIGAVAAVLGLYLSYYLNVPSGAAIVLVATGFFFLAVLFAPQRGWLWPRRRLPAP